MENFQKRGRPAKFEHICGCCDKFFETAMQKGKHEAYMRKVGKFQKLQKFNQSQLTPSVNHDLIATIEDKLIKNFATPIDKSATSATTDDTLLKTLEKTPQYQQAKLLCDSGDFANLPTDIDQKYGLSFLMITSKMTNLPTEFVFALIKVLNVIGIEKIPQYIFPPFARFMDSFDPTLYNEDEIDLKVVYEFSKKVNCNLSWLSKLNDVTHLVVDPSTLTEKESGLLVDTFLSQLSLFSASFFRTFDKVMAHASYQRGFHNYIEPFFDFLYLCQDKNVCFDLLLTYVKLQRENPNCDVNQLAQLIIQNSYFQLSNEQILALVRASIIYDQDLVLKLLNSREEDEDMSSFMERMEDIHKEKQKRGQRLEEEKEQNKKQELIQQAKLKQQKEIEKKEEEKNRFLAESKQKQETEAFQKAVEENFSELLKMNEALEKEKLDAIFSFEKELQEIASKIKVRLRPDQLVTIGLMLTSQKHTTLFQAATGTGKSLIFGVTGIYIHKTTGKKVIILVPTEFLHAYQAHYYCQEACDIPGRICDPNFPGVFYCSYERFNTPDFVVPPNTIILVDEFHELFFEQQIQLHDNKLVSHIQKLLSAEKIIGVSATYRGNNGLDKIKSIMTNSQCIKSTDNLKERQLQLKVFGKLSQEDIIERAIKLARERTKEQPVIMFCEDPNAMKKLIPEGQIFDGIDVGDQMAILEDLREVEKVIIITKSAWCKGVDFVFKVPQAFVIFTMLPKSNVQLQQDSGRGVRGHFDLPIVGAVFTKKSYSNLEQLQAGLKHLEQFEKLYPSDYLQSLQYLLGKEEQISTEKQIEAFHKAVEVLNNNGKLNQVQSCFSRVRITEKLVPKQVVALSQQPKANEVPDFDMDVIANSNLPGEQKEEVKSDETLLAKRKHPEVNSNQKVCGALSRQLTPAQKSKATKLAKHAVGTKNIFEFVQKRQKVSEEQEQLNNEADEVLQQQQEASNEQQEVSAYQEEEMQGSKQQVIVDPKALDEKEIAEAKAVLEKHGFKIPEGVKRKQKEADKVEMRSATSKAQSHSKSEIQSVTSKANSSKRSEGGRFLSNYNVGDKKANGCILKPVLEEHWEPTTKDKKCNQFYKCLRCLKEKVRKDDRRTHRCK